MAGRVFVPQNENCDEPEEGESSCQKISLKVNEKIIPLNIVDACPHGCRVVYLQEWDNLLWVGLGNQGEYSMYGYGLQVYDLNTNKKVFEFSGDSSGRDILVGSLNKEPITGDVIVGTPNGFLIIPPDFKMIKSFFFFMDFNPFDFRASHQLSTTIKNDNYFAMMAWDLKMEDQRDFYQQIKNSNYIAPENMVGFYPTELNGLIPSIQQVAQATDGKKKSAEHLLCHFNDPRIIAKAIDSNDICHAKFKEANLLPKEMKTDYQTYLLEQLKKTLSQYSSKDNFTIYSYAKDLKLLGNDSGYAEINRIIKNSPVGTGLEGFVYHVTPANGDLIPGMVGAIEKRQKDLKEACLYLARTGEKNLNPQHALVIVKSLQRLIHNHDVKDITNRNDQDDIDECSRTFFTYMSVAAVKEGYYSLVSQLNKEERKLSDDLLIYKIHILRALRNKNNYI